MHQPCKSNTGISTGYLPLSFAAMTASTPSNRPKSKNKPRALSTTSVSKLRISFAAGAAQLADFTRATKAKSCLQHLICNRFYDPKVGRFTAEDPAWSFLTDKKYRYVLNSPMNLTDPYGLTELGTVKCHANCSGLYPEVNKDVPDILRNCVMQHENDHMDWMQKNYWPQACCDSGGCAKEGTQARIPKNDQDDVECRAYNVEKNCIHNLVSAANWQTIRNRENDVDAMMKRYCKKGR